MIRRARRAPCAAPRRSRVAVVPAEVPRPHARRRRAAASQLKRTLGPFQLTILGIGAIVGAGIFSTIGTAAAGGAGHAGAGPAIVLSFMLTAIACGFAALCYAEFAAMVPIAGSAYTYAYATLGELVAWIIGWDLIIEYAVGNVAVAISWSGYFQELLRRLRRRLPAVARHRLPVGRDGRPAGWPRHRGRGRPVVARAGGHAGGAGARRTRLASPASRSSSTSRRSSS